MSGKILIVTGDGGEGYETLYALPSSIVRSLPHLRSEQLTWGG